MRKEALTETAGDYSTRSMLSWETKYALETRLGEFNGTEYPVSWEKGIRTDVSPLFKEEYGTLPKPDDERLLFVAGDSSSRTDMFRDARNKTIIDLSR
jgi:hypothetical protein